MDVDADVDGDESVLWKKVAEKDEVGVCVLHNLRGEPAQSKTWIGSGWRWGVHSIIASNFVVIQMMIGPMQIC